MRSDLKWNVARSIAKSYYVRGYEEDDLVQEAIIAMWRAPETNDMRKVARHRLFDLLRQSRTAAKHVLNYSVFKDVESFTMQELPEPPKALTPPCHPWGSAPEGYDMADPLCHNCPDKFSCLQHTEIEGLTEATVADDPEVELVVSAIESRDGDRARLAYEIVIERQKRRVRLRNVHQDIPEELQVFHPVVLPPKPAPKHIQFPLCGGTPGAPLPREPIPTPEGVKMPKPREASPLDLENALARVKIGQPFELEPGHVLVKRKKDVDVCVEIRENGFWLNLNQEIYRTPSTAIRAAELMLGCAPSTRYATNAYFDIGHKNNTEIRDSATGAILACRKGTR